VLRENGGPGSRATPQAISRETERGPGRETPRKIADDAGGQSPEGLQPCNWLALTYRKLTLLPIAAFKAETRNSCESWIVGRRRGNLFDDKEGRSGRGRRIPRSGRDDKPAFEARRADPGARPLRTCRGCFYLRELAVRASPPLKGDRRGHRSSVDGYVILTMGQARPRPGIFHAAIHNKPVVGGREERVSRARSRRRGRSRGVSQKPLFRSTAAGMSTAEGRRWAVRSMARAESHSHAPSRRAGRALVSRPRLSVSGAPTRGTLEKPGIFSGQKTMASEVAMDPGHATHAIASVVVFFVLAGLRLEGPAAPNLEHLAPVVKARCPAANHTGGRPGSANPPSPCTTTTRRAPKGGGAEKRRSSPVKAHHDRAAASRKPTSRRTRARRSTRRLGESLRVFVEKSTTRRSSRAKSPSSSSRRSKEVRRPASGG